MQYYQQNVEWEPCEHGFACASVAVPLDYSKPGGEQIRLSVIRLPARDPDRRLGSLFVNPGGPGASGVGYARSARGSIGEEILDRYDLVGFDPRGVGASAPIACLSGPQTDTMLADLGQPDAAVPEAAVVAQANAFGRECAAKSPNLTPNIGTVPAARDLDILRALVGDGKLNFLGRSYGTFLGATFADLFPERVGRMVLDGAISPTVTMAELAKGQAEGFQLALERFAADCVRRGGCPIGRGSAADAVATINRWLDSVAARPLKAGGRLLTRSLALTGIVGSLYEPSVGWPSLRQALRAGLKGDARPLIESTDAFTGRMPDGEYAGNSVDALYAVNCLDRADDADPADTAVLAREWASSAPTFGAYFAWGNLPCATWPSPPTDSPHVITATGSGPILVVGTRFDPATPIAWSEQLAGMLANASLLVWEGDGHTAYFRGSDCVDRAVDRFLVAGTEPASPARC